MTEIKSLILAGGESSRMGFDKSLRFREEIYTVMQEVFPEVAFSLRPDQVQDKFYDDKTVVVDEILEGPMSGIYTSLRELGTSIFVVACDMPFIKKEDIRLLLSSRAKEATVFVTEGFIQPLFALYEYSLLESLKETLEDKNSGRGLNKFWQLYTTLT